MIYAKLRPDDDILVNNIVFPLRPGPYARTAAGLVGIRSSGIQLSVGVLGNVQVMIGKLCALGVEAVWMGEQLLEGWERELEAFHLAVDEVAGCLRVHDLECPVSAVVYIYACGFVHQHVFGGVAVAVGIEIVLGHGVGLSVD